MSDLNENAKVETLIDVNAEAKAIYETAGLSAAIINFIVDEKQNRVMNSEGLELGDELTIVGIADKLDSFNENQYISVLTTGARDTISVNRLIGSPKEKYFAKERTVGKDALTTTIDYDMEKVFKLPRRIGDATLEILKLKGKTIKLVAIADKCGRDANRTYYRFVFVD